MAALLDTRSPEENPVQIISLIGILLLLVFYSDITTPLGLMTWILYFIPLIMTLYLRWQYSPFVVTGISILFIIISFFFSPRDMSEFYALVNRIFFCVLLIVLASLIWSNKRRVLFLQSSKDKFQAIVESSPLLVVIITDKDVLYINPAGMDLITGDSQPGSVDFWIHLFSTDNYEMIRSGIMKAKEGAMIEYSNLLFGITEQKSQMADIWIREIAWDETSAVQMVIRIQV
jgi:PAS domain-containing protein